MSYRRDPFSPERERERENRESSLVALNPTPFSRNKIMPNVAAMVVGLRNSLRKLDISHCGITVRAGSDRVEEKREKRSRPRIEKEPSLSLSSFSGQDLGVFSLAVAHSGLTHLNLSANNDLGKESVRGKKKKRRNRILTPFHFSARTSHKVGSI
jgi:hypothetical protein